MNRGYTLIEVMVVAGIMSILAAVVLGGVARCSVEEPGTIEQDVKVWMKAMDIQGKVSCAARDSDRDGYVSCTINQDGKLLAVECASKYSWNEGCRVPKATVNYR